MHNKPHSEESRRKMSKSHKRRGTKPPSQLGIKQSKDTIAKRVAKLRGKKRPPFSEKWKKRIGDARRGKANIKNRGKNSNFWRGGISKVNDIIRHSLEYRLWREAVFARDNWTCIFCYRRSEKGQKIVLNVDHIKPFAYFPELRFAIDNGRTLCIECHKKTDTWGINQFNNKKCL